MSRYTLRAILIIGVFCLAGTLLTQAYWVSKNFALKEKELDFTVREALQHVAQAILQYNKNTSPLVDPVVQLRPDYFITKVNDKIEPALLEGLLKREFLKLGLKTDLVYTIYDCQQKQVNHAGTVYFGADKPLYASKRQAPYTYNNYYFSVYLPARNLHLWSEVKLWMVSTCVLLVVVAFFSYLLFVVLRQRRLSEIQKDFINNMTHEFRTPLATILLSARAMKEKTMLEHPIRLSRYASIVEAEAERLSHQVERVLQVATLDNEQVQLRKETLDVPALIKEAVECISASFPNNSSFIHQAVSDNPLSVVGDKLHLFNVLLNLLDNAVKYSPKHSSIQIRAVKVNGSVRIEIEDNGLGISKEHQRKIFDKFFRVSNGLVHDVKGFGLGLHYVKRIVEAHGGSIRVHSEPNRGTTFSLFFPIV